MEQQQRRRLRHDVLGCLNSIRLSLEVLRYSKNREEIDTFLDCAADEVLKVEDMLNSWAYGEAHPTGLPPTENTDLPAAAN